MGEKEMIRLTGNVSPEGLHSSRFPISLSLACESWWHTGTRVGAVSKNWMTKGFLNLSVMSTKRKDLESKICFVLQNSKFLLR